MRNRYLQSKYLTKDQQLEGIEPESLPTNLKVSLTIWHYDATLDLKAKQAHILPTIPCIMNQTEMSLQCWGSTTSNISLSLLMTSLASVTLHLLCLQGWWSPSDGSSFIFIKTTCQCSFPLCWAESSSVPSYEYLSALIHRIYWLF